MDGSTIVQLIGSLGFPIAACCYMFYSLEKEREAHKEETRQITETHKEELTQITAALQNNTIALQQLTDKLSK